LKIAILGAPSSYRSRNIASHSEARALTGNNTGNAVYQDALEILYPEAKWILWHEFFANPDLVKNFDQVLISLANQIGKHTDMSVFAEALSKISVPVVAIGLGAQASYGKKDFSVSAGTLAFVEQIQNHRMFTNQNNLWVRGVETKKMLLELGFDSTAIGCPSMFINPKIDLGFSILQKYVDTDRPKFGIAAGHSSWQVTREIEAQLISLLEYNNDYFLQSDEWLFNLADGQNFDEFPEHPRKAIEKLLHLIKREDWHRWLNDHAVTYTQISSWMQNLSEYEFITGGRIHGNILSLQSETMTLAWAIDQRIAELCIQTGVPFLSPNQIESTDQDLLRKLHKSAIPALKNFDRNRSWQAWSVGNFLHANGLPVPVQIRDLAAVRDKYEVCQLSQVIEGVSPLSVCTMSSKINFMFPNAVSGFIGCSIHSDDPIPLKIYLDNILIDIIVALNHPDKVGRKFFYKFKKLDKDCVITMRTISDEDVFTYNITRREHGSDSAEDYYKLR
jgi:hypothetical protein